VTEQTVTPLHLDRVRDELKTRAAWLTETRQEMATALTSDAWRTSAAVDYFTPSIVRAEVEQELYQLVRAGGATAEAWGTTLTTAMRYATEQGASTSPLANGLTALRSDAARKWITTNRLVWPELPHEVLAWAPFDI